MHDILIVDDDPIIREGLSRMIQGFADCPTVHMAGNGSEALETVCSACIGMIFLDIKMPVLGGIELMHKLSDMEYRGEVVVVSGFDDYEFVRSAMKLGASDYILKPVCENNLRVVYTECRARIAARMGKLATPQFGKKDLLRDIYAQQADVEHIISGRSEIASFLRQKEMPANSRVVAAVLDSFGKGVVSDMDKQALHLLGLSMLDACVSSPPAHMVQGEYQQLFVMLVFLPEEAAGGISAKLSHAITEQGMRYGISRKVYPADHAAEAYTEALACLEQYFYDLQEEAPEDSNPYPFSRETSVVIDTVAERDTIGADQAILALFQQISYARPGVESVKQLLASMVYTLMNKNKDFIGIVGKYKFTDKDIVHMVREAKTISRMKKDFLSLIHVYIDALNEKLLSRDEYAIQKTKYYIENNYQSNLKLAEIAERLGLHPNYLSTLYSSKTGETFSDYLRKVRMGKAVSLMADTNLKIYEIACKVGYSDTTQFYRAFKHAMGVSPGEYKRYHM